MGETKKISQLITPEAPLVDYSHIELTEKEQSESFQWLMDAKKYEHYKVRYAELILEGKTVKEADKQAKDEEEFLCFDLTPQEKEECFKTAKESKFYRMKANEYFESLKKPKQYPLPPKEEFYAQVDYRLKDLTGEEVQCKQLELLKWYFTKDTRFSDAGYSLSKGLILFGPVGCGKTTLMKAFTKNPQQSYTVVSCRKLADQYKQEGMNGIYKYFDTVKNNMPHLYYGHTQLGWCFDDLGTESNKKNYGDELNVMSETILNWYDKIGVGFNKIHITTNLTGDQIKEVYGYRVASRMREMFNVIEFDSNEKDKRK